MRSRVLTLVALGGLALLTGPPDAKASFIQTYYFAGLTSNSATDIAIGENQLRVDLHDGGVVAGEHYARFRFRNDGLLASSITAVYFQDGALIDLAEVIYSGGVEFSENEGNFNLPGGNELGFHSTKKFSTGLYSADSNPPTAPNGVNPNEWLDVIFLLKDGYTAQDVKDSLNGDNDLTLKIGIHVQAFTGGGSESFLAQVDDPNVGVGGGGGEVPVPGGIVLLGSALVSFCGYRGLRRRPQQDPTAA